MYGVQAWKMDAQATQNNKEVLPVLVALCALGSGSDEKTKTLFNMRVTQLPKKAVFGLPQATEPWG